MNVFKKLTIIFFGALFLVGCGDNFLDVDSRDRVAEEDRDVTYTPDEFVIGIYGQFTDFTYAFSWLGVTEIISDNASKGSEPSDSGGDKDLLDNFQFSSTSASVSAMWSKWYATIGRATYAIEFTEGYGLQDTALETRLIAEARFLRGLSYFFLVRYFGDVPIQSEDLTVRAPVDEVYDYIIADFEFALENLPAKSEYPDSELGRATSGAAAGYLAKVYLQRENWQEAVNYADQVIGSGEYDLSQPYETIWREEGENGAGSIFEIQARGENIAHGIQQYSATQGGRGSGGWGWGFNTPTQNLVDAFDSEGDEIRKNATIIFRGETLYDGFEASSSLFNPMYNEKAYSSEFTRAGDSDKNMRLLRYAEIQLIKAEAENELGNTGVAQDALNRVRNRVELDDKNINDQGELRQAIWKERRLELAFEHDRWFDLLRTGQAAEAIQNSGNEEAAANFDEHFLLFPIPAEQIRQTPGMEQNPGY